jgi:hypothetical protein
MAVKLANFSLCSEPDFSRGLFYTRWVDGKNPARPGVAMNDPCRA